NAGSHMRSPDSVLSNRQSGATLISAHGHVALEAYLAPRQQAVDISRNVLITGAGLFLQAFAIEDLDLTPGGVDRLGRLESGGDDRHGSPAHAKHLAQEFLGERDGIVSRLVVRLQQPACQTRADV